MDAGTKAFIGAMILIMCFAGFAVAVMPKPSDEEYFKSFATDMLKPESDGVGRMVWVIMTDKHNCKLTIFSQNDRPILDTHIGSVDCARMHDLVSSQKP